MALGVGGVLIPGCPAFCAFFALPNPYSPGKALTLSAGLLEFGSASPAANGKGGCSRGHSLPSSLLRLASAQLPRSFCAASISVTPTHLATQPASLPRHRVCGAARNRWLQ